MLPLGSRVATAFSLLCFSRGPCCRVLVGTPPCGGRPTCVATDKAPDEVTGGEKQGC